MIWKRENLRGVYYEKITSSDLSASVAIELLHGNAFVGIWFLFACFTRNMGL